MDNLSKVLLSGVALSAVAAVPANAGQFVTNSPLKFHGMVHHKTGVAHVGHQASTFTFTYSTTIHYSLHHSTALNVTYDLLAIGFITATSGGQCANFYPKNKVKIAKPVGLKAKAKAYAVTGHTAFTFGGGTYCKGGTITFYGPTYELKAKKTNTGSDTLKWTDSVKTSGKNKGHLSLYYTVSID
jgi:hypothetical protein